MSLCSLDSICNYHQCRHSITSDERATELPCLSDSDAFILDTWHAAVSVLISSTTFSLLWPAWSSMSILNGNATAALPGAFQRPHTLHPAEHQPEVTHQHWSWAIAARSMPSTSHNKPLDCIIPPRTWPGQCWALLTWGTLRAPYPCCTASVQFHQKKKRQSHASAISIIFRRQSNHSHSLSPWEILVFFLPGA